MTRNDTRSASRWQLPEPALTSPGFVSVLAGMAFRLRQLVRWSGFGLVLANALPAQTWQLAEDEFIREHAKQYVEAGHAPGVVIGLLDLSAAPERRVRFFSHGQSGRRQVMLGPDTMFELGSLTKAMTGLMVAEMAGRGELQLDSTLGRLTTTLKMPLPPDVSAITIEQLATHRSGMPRISFHPLDLLPMIFSRDPYAGTTATDVFEAAARTPMRKAPGDFAYSNLGYGILGQALAAHAGHSFEELLRDCVVDRYGLGGAVTSPDLAPAARLARGHAANRWPARHWHVDGYAPAGCLVGSARDLIGFFQRVLENPTPAWLLASTPRHATDKSGERQVGLGWMVWKGTNGALVWHNGGTGGFRTFAGVVPERKLAVVVLTNGSGNADALALSLLGHGRGPAAPRGMPWMGLLMSLLGIVVAPTIVWTAGRSTVANAARTPDRVDALLALATAAFLLGLSATNGAWQIIPVALWWVAAAITLVLAALVVMRRLSSRPWLTGSRGSRAGRTVLLVIFAALAVMVAP